MDGGSFHPAPPHPSPEGYLMSKKPSLVKVNQVVINFETNIMLLIKSFFLDDQKVETKI